jgi:predicted dinucleotide-binding enzyme
MSRARIGIIGSGAVGTTLGTGLAALGHEVMIGSRDPRKLDEWRSKAGGHAHAGTFEEAARFGEIVILATAWSGTREALALAGADNLAGKVLLDATNPLKFADGKLVGLVIGNDDSAGEEVQRLLPGTHVVKCFNTVGNAHMVQPSFPGGPPDMFIAGNDAGAKQTTVALLAELGWPTVVDLGGIEASRWLEAMCIAWCLHGFRSGSWNHAFKLLTK